MVSVGTLGSFAQFGSFSFGAMSNYESLHSLFQCVVLTTMPMYSASDSTLASWKSKWQIAEQACRGFDTTDATAI